MFVPKGMKFLMCFFLGVFYCIKHPIGDSWKNMYYCEGDAWHF